jgi:hypothetical protein
LQTPAFGCNETGRTHTEKSSQVRMKLWVKLPYQLRMHCDQGTERCEKVVNVVCWKHFNSSILALHPGVVVNALILWFLTCWWSFYIKRSGIRGSRCVMFWGYTVDPVLLGKKEKFVIYSENHMNLQDKKGCELK